MSLPEKGAEVATVPACPGCSASQADRLAQQDAPPAAAAAAASSESIDIGLTRHAALSFPAEQRPLAGPGCSSFDGALMEIGPLRMAEGLKGQVVEQDGAWNEYANVLFSESSCHDCGAELRVPAWTCCAPRCACRHQHWLMLASQCHCSRPASRDGLLLRPQPEVRAQRGRGRRTDCHLPQELLRGLSRVRQDGCVFSCHAFLFPGFAMHRLQSTDMLDYTAAVHRRRVLRRNMDPLPGARNSAHNEQPERLLSSATQPYLTICTCVSGICTAQDQAHQSTPQRPAHRERLDRPILAVPGLRRLCIPDQAP